MLIAPLAPTDRGHKSLLRSLTGPDRLQFGMAKWPIGGVWALHGVMRYMALVRREAEEGKEGCWRQSATMLLPNAQQTGTGQPVGPDAPRWLGPCCSATPRRCWSTPPRAWRRWTGS